MSTRFIGFGFVAAVAAAALFLPAPASAGHAGIVDYSADGSLAQTVGYWGKRRWWRRDYDGREYVRAPFTSVATGRGTAVDAPFTSVRTGRRGTWVRAPFVNLFVPD